VPKLAPHERKRRDPRPLARQRGHARKERGPRIPGLWNITIGGAVWLLNGPVAKADVVTDWNVTAGDKSLPCINIARLSPFMCRFSDAGMTRLSTRCGGRRPKSAKARNRGKWGTGGAAGAMEI